MRLAGSSEEGIAGAESAPVWPSLRALAPTLRYDAACLGDGPPPAELLASVTRPALLTTGATMDPHMAGLPADYFGAAADATAALLPDARRRTIEVAWARRRPRAARAGARRVLRGLAKAAALQGLEGAR